MDRKIEIIDRYKEKIRLLKKHNKLYFNKDNPEISDAEYDSLKKEIVYLEKNNKFLKKLNLNEGLVGSFPSNKFKKILCTVIFTFNRTLFPGRPGGKCFSDPRRSMANPAFFWSRGMLHSASPPLLRASI